MEVFVNNQKQTVEADYNLTQLFNHLDIETPGGTAVALNNSVVPRANWEKQLLKNGDNILIIKATQGG
ncbi:MAG: sulfur carrier protein ThiS [Prolixibacteraceae bacterium]|jgi:sulfur carrier protein|nr:sulfur carrier protein ThiS [Prolixibacteraceae bacterium]